MKRKTYDEQTLYRVARFLPDAIAYAVTSYRAYMKRDVSREEFSEHHKNLKIAAAHIELLLKLAAMIVEAAENREEDGGDANDSAVLGAIMREAQGELLDYRRLRKQED